MYSKTPTTLIVLIILLDFTIQAIIVERNLHSYYRLPTTTVKTSNDSEDYYILQCPFKSSLHIPKPQEMPVCIIVGRHSENKEKQKELVKAKPRSTLNTQVDYRYLKPPKLLKLVKIKNGKPYTTMLLKPIAKKEYSYKRPKTEIKEQYTATNIKLYLPNPKMLLNHSTVLYPIPLVHKLTKNDSMALSSINEPQKLTQTLKPPTDLEGDLKDDPLDEEDTQASPLKYLAVQDTLKQLQLAQQLPRPTVTNPSVFKAQKFFADFKNAKKGFRTKGYQNMYHRDEIYQDHILYDELQQMGNYRIKQKLEQPQQP